MHHIYDNCCTLGRFGWRKDRDQHLTLICVSVYMYAEGGAFLQLLISPFRLTDGCVQAEETTFITDNFTEWMLCSCELWTREHKWNKTISVSIETVEHRAKISSSLKPWSNYLVPSVQFEFDRKEQATEGKRNYSNGTRSPKCPGWLEEAVFLVVT